MDSIGVVSVGPYSSAARRVIMSSLLYFGFLRKNESIWEQQLSDTLTEENQIVCPYSEHFH
jgi:hypothetical protein